MWIVLVAGAYITVAFTYLFGFERRVMQQLMIGGLSLTIGLVLFLVVGSTFRSAGASRSVRTRFRRCSITGTSTGADSADASRIEEGPA